MSIGFEVPAFDPSPGEPCFCNSGLAFGDCCGSKSARRKPPAGVRVAQSFLNQTSCKAWVNYLEKRPRNRGRVLDLDHSSPDSPIYIEDQARVCDEVDAGNLRQGINDTVERAYRMRADELGREIAWFETPRVLRYSPGGYYIRHADSCQVDARSGSWHRVEDRDLSMLIYINDDFTGGGLTFVNFNCHFQPRPGDLLMFPSDNRYEHRAEVVKTGYRYAIACWAAFTDSPRVREQPPADAIFLNS